MINKIKKLLKDFVYFVYFDIAKQDEDIFAFTFFVIGAVLGTLTYTLILLLIK